MTDKRRSTTGKLHLGRSLAGGLLVLGVAAVALNLLQPDSRHEREARGGAASVPAFIVGESPRHPGDVLQTKATVSGEVDALAAIMRKWGLRRIAVCAPGDGAAPTVNAGASHATVLRCSGSGDAIADDARAIAAARSQAVIYSGAADDAAAFIAALRTEHSFAMVVLASSVDRDRVSRLLPGDARRWVLAAGRRASDGSDDALTLTVAMLGNRDRHAR